MTNATIRFTLLLALAFGAFGCTDDTAAEDGPEGSAMAAQPAAGDAPAVPTEEGPLEPEGLSCTAFITKLVELVAEDPAPFVTAADQDDWIAVCEQVGDLNDEGNREVANCFMAANGEEASECGEAEFLAGWMDQPVP